MTDIKISAAINTYNEEANIERCLACLVDHVDEIVVSDMHSSDRTVEICRRFGAKVFSPTQARHGQYRPGGAGSARTAQLDIRSRR